MAGETRAARKHRRAVWKLTSARGREATPPSPPPRSGEGENGPAPARVRVASFQAPPLRFGEGVGGGVISYPLRALLMADGKWIHGLTPEMAQAKAARARVDRASGGGRHWLPKATSRPVAIRRTSISCALAPAGRTPHLRLFRSCLPGRTYRNARARLRTIRRAAGAARDWDVFLIELRERSQTAAATELPGWTSSPATPSPSAAPGAGRPGRRREPPVRARSWNSWRRRSKKSARPTSDAGLMDLARPLLGEMLSRLHDSATDDLTDYDHLHQVRIAGKRLRAAGGVRRVFCAAAARAALSDGRGDAGNTRASQRQSTWPSSV